MDVQNDQYQRDITRIEAHKLALKDDEFRKLSDLVLKEVRAHERFLREERGAAIVLHDRFSPITVENVDGLRRAVFAFNSVRFEVDVQSAGIHYLFSADVNPAGKPVVIGRKFGQSLGEVGIDVVTEAIRSAINSITDLPKPIS